MLTGKQKRFLRSIGSTTDPIVFIGKGELNDNLIKQLNDALIARELVKCRVLKNCMITVEEVAEDLSIKTKSEIVQIIGNNFILFKTNPEKHMIVLPGE